MPLFLLFFGALLLVASIRDANAGDSQQITKLTQLLKSDFTGPNNFFIWIIAIGGIAAIGYAKPLKTFSNLFLALIFIVMVLVKKGPNGQDLLSSFIAQIRSTERTTIS